MSKTTEKITPPHTTIWENTCRIFQGGTYIVLGNNIYYPGEEDKAYILQMPTDYAYYFTLELFMRAYLGGGIQVANFYISGLIDNDKTIKNVIVQKLGTSSALEYVKIKGTSIYVSRKNSYSVLVAKSAILLTANIDAKKAFKSGFSIALGNTPEDAINIAINNF